MDPTESFGLVVLVVSVGGLLAVVSSRLTERIRLPLPALVLFATAVAMAILPGARAPSQAMVQRVVSVALVCVLFDGGMQLGWRRFRSVLAPITVVGVPGTFLTAVGGAVVLHLVFGLGWYPALLVGTALAATDPTVVFSVLGRRQVAGPSGIILQGESGANDPVGIALMASLISAGGVSASGVAHAATEFVLQMAVGAAVGVTGGLGIVWFVRRVSLPGEGLYPLRTLASALTLFGAATVAHGSGFLAVFVAGIILGDQRAPYNWEIERFHRALASLGEIVAFAALGLTVDLAVLARHDVWLPGLLYGLVLAVIIRPVLIGLCLLPARLPRNDTAFILFAGLKGAVPILLGGSMITAEIADSRRLYGIVIIAVVFSVVVQGSLTEPVARALRLRVQYVEPEPWAVGIRLSTEPDNVHHLTVTDESPAVGTAVAELAQLPRDAWIALMIRDGHLQPIRGDTRLQSGDALTIIADPARTPELARIFEQPTQATE